MSGNAILSVTLMCGLKWSCLYMLLRWLLQIYKEECMDLLVPVSKRDKDQLTIREDVTGGIKVNLTFFTGSLKHIPAYLPFFGWIWLAVGLMACLRNP